MGVGRILVVGLGSIARRHIRNGRALDPAARFAVLRHREAALPEEVGREVEAVFTRMEDALAWGPTEAWITGPSSMHLASARPLAEAGVHLLIEKPIADRLDGVAGLLETARSRGITLMVAYNFRFSSALRALKQALDAGAVGRLLHIRAEAGQYLPDWRPSIRYQDSVSASKELGGGVLLELSHELDYVRWLAGEVTSVSALVGKQSDLELDVEDTADLLLSFAGGATGQVHVDMIQRVPSRSCKIIGSEGTLTWNALSGEVILHRADGGAPRVVHVAGIEDRNTMYVEELKHFLACCEGRAQPEASGEEALRVLQLIAAARRSAEAGLQVKVESGVWPELPFV